MKTFLILTTLLKPHTNTLAKDGRLTRSGLLITTSNQSQDNSWVARLNSKSKEEQNQALKSEFEHCREN